MSEQFRTLSDLPECDNLKESKIQESKNKLGLQDFDEINAGDFSDIDDSDVKGFLKGNMDACKDTTQKKLIVLRNIYNENQEGQVNPEISKEEHNQNMLDLKKGSLVGFNIEGYTEKSGEITHLVAKGQTLGEVIQITYGYTKWSEIAVEIEKAKAYNLSKGVVLNDNVKEGQKINLFIEDIDEVSKRLADRQEEERIERAKNNQIELKKLEESRVNNEGNKIGKSFFKAEIKEEGFKLSLAPYSGELNSDAYEIYSNMKDTRGTQKIGQYRNSNGEIEDIILGDNKGKNIYMELDGSYRWDDIDSGKIDSISSQQELESVMKNLLKKYEKENREDI